MSFAFILINRLISQGFQSGSIGPGCPGGPDGPSCHGGQGGPSGLSDPCDLCRWSELSWCLEWSRGHVGQDYQPR